MLDACRDQAEGLRRLFDRRHAHVVTVAAGFPGVGVTATVINLAAALAALGHRTLAIDENRGPANVCGTLGLAARRDLLDVVSGECSLDDALVAGPGELAVLPAARAAGAPSARTGSLAAAFRRVNERFDIVLIDARSAASGGLSALCAAVQDTVVICSGAGAAITRSYALIKRLHGAKRGRRYRVLMNRVLDANTARLVFGNLERVSRRHLDTPLEFLGHVPHDERARLAEEMMQPVVTAFPAGPAAAAFRASAEAVAGWPVGRHGQCGGDGLLERLFGAGPGELTMEAA